jgi:hypothetical protein
VGAATSSHTHSVKINGSTKTIEASGGTAVDLGTFKNFNYAKVYVTNNAYNASSTRYFLLADCEKTYTANWQDTAEFKMTAYPGPTPKYMVFRLCFSGTKTTCSTPTVYELYSGNLSSEERKVIEVRYTTSVVSNTSITVHTYIYIDRNYLQSQWTSFHLVPLSIGVGDRSNDIDNGLKCWNYKWSETYVTSLPGTTVAHSSETLLANISGNAATATTATNANNINVAVGNAGEIKLVGVSSATAGNFQAKIHPNIRAFYNADNNGHILIIGSETSTGGAKDKASIRFSGGAGYYASLLASAFTANRNITLPDATGTIALQNGTYSGMTVGNATTASSVSNGGAGTTNAARHIWFSDSSDETKRVYNDNFKYNPSGNIISSNISGTAAKATGDGSGNNIINTYATKQAMASHESRLGAIEAAYPTSYYLKADGTSAANGGKQIVISKAGLKISLETISKSSGNRAWGICVNQSLGSAKTISAVVSYKGGLSNTSTGYSETYFTNNLSMPSGTSWQWLNGNLSGINAIGSNIHSVDVSAVIEFNGFMIDFHGTVFKGDASSNNCHFMYTVYVANANGSPT